MHQFYSEVLSQQRRLEMSKQAERERLAMAAQRLERSTIPFHRSWAQQLGSSMVKWGHRLEQFGTTSRATCSVASQRH